MRTLIGIVTFGNLPFTQLTVRSIRQTTTRPYDLFVVIGKPGDADTEHWLSGEGIPYLKHLSNAGFPASLNDIYDYAWNNGLSLVPTSPLDFDNLILAGNDVVPYPGAINALIDVAAASGWEWVCSSQFDARSLCAHYPEVRQYFEGENYLFNQWEEYIVAPARAKVYAPKVRPWELHNDKVPPPRIEGIQPDCIKDVRNLCLFKRSVFDKIGYADVNFWPGGYFEDNDYCTRARKAGIKACGVAHSAYFHFWSRTIHQGEGTTSRQFQHNSRFYELKWGGAFDHETFELPFHGNRYAYCDPARGLDVTLGLGSLKIANRNGEEQIIQYWRGQSAK